MIISPFGSNNLYSPIMSKTVENTTWKKTSDPAVYGFTTQQFFS